MIADRFALAVMSRIGSRRLLLPLLALAAPATLTHAAPGDGPPATQIAGPWASGHVQGIAVDRKGGFIYYSFTNLLAKYDFRGRLVGTLSGWSGHLGDLDFNPADGKVYGSLEYGKSNSFYIAVIDGSRLDRTGMKIDEVDILRVVYLPEVARDYAADLDGDGKLLPAPSPDHRYGCSGIDGVGFGPAFGPTFSNAGGKYYLTVAYGIYGDATRSDNDHQILLQYDVDDWAEHAGPLDEKALHSNLPPPARGKYFVRTGNTRYGVQNLAYDPTLHRWFLGVYGGNKPNWPNYLLFAIDGRSSPKSSDLVGVPDRSGSGWERGLLLPLAPDGLYDVGTGIRGWKQKADVGFQPLGDGFYYFVQNMVGKGGQSAELRLMQWTGNPSTPFAPARTP
jgi:hypothetical protein